MTAEKYTFPGLDGVKTYFPIVPQSGSAPLARGPSIRKRVVRSVPAYLPSCNRLAVSPLASLCLRLLWRYRERTATALPPRCPSEKARADHEEKAIEVFLQQAEQLAENEPAQ